MTQKTALDTAGRVEISPDSHQFVQSDPAHGIIMTHPINGDIGNRSVRTFRLLWTPATRALAENIRHHYEANAHVAFSQNLPGGEEVSVIYLNRPSFRQRSTLAVDVTVNLEEALITD